MQLDHVRSQFTELFGKGEAAAFHSPGRVNLIGEHTDYNGGYVFPCALTLGTYGITRTTDTGRLRLASANFGASVVEISLDGIEPNAQPMWTNYPLGVVREFQKLGQPLGGLDLLVAGDLPNSAGLSSSASVEVLMGVVLNDLFGCGLGMVEIAKLAQRAENLFVGVNCGIMDQFAIAMGRRDNAVLLNCKNLEYRYIPAALDGHCLVISNTNCPRGLAGSKYNERRGQCEAAVEMLREELDISLLGEVSPAEYEAHKHLITDDLIRRRAEHIVYETQRTKDAADSLSRGDLAAFGKHMNASHESLANLFEITGSELDALAYAAQRQDGVRGSRMTGGGFGGCTVSLVEEAHVESFKHNVGASYRAATGITPDFYIANIGSGAGRIG
ncbi:MAG: galactokinase [Defluviitaleaceae bacterium]|nr:galactokinase [Defluviitaleaceae bacterium]